MYIRRGQFVERFIIMESKPARTGIGRPAVEYVSSGEVELMIDTISAQEKERLRQLKHAVDTVLIQRYGEPVARIGWRLINGEKIFQIERVERLIGYVLYYCTERGDL